MRENIRTIHRAWPAVAAAAVFTSSLTLPAAESESSARSASEVFAAVASHEFHPVVSGFTHDRTLGKPGIASLDDPGWKIRTLALRDLARLGPEAESGIRERLFHENLHVRYIAAAALGIRAEKSAVGDLARVLQADPEMLVRSQAAIALRQIGRRSGDRAAGDPVVVSALDAALEDKEEDVRHQARLALESIRTEIGPDEKLRDAFASLDEDTFETAAVGEPAPDFALPDTRGRDWKLSDFRGRQPVVLVWIFADW